MNGNRSFEQEAQSEIVISRLDLQSKQNRLEDIFNQCGPEHDFSKVTVINGTPREKMRIARKLVKDCEVLDNRIQSAVSAITGRKVKPMAKTSYRNIERDYTDELYNLKLEDERKDDKGFASLGAFVLKVIEDPGSLKSMGIDVGESGGFLIPDQYASRIMMVSPQDAVIRPRALVLPPGTPPDAKFDLPALRQGPNGMLGGVTFIPANEGTAGAVDDPKLDLCILEPQRMVGTITIGNSLLRNELAVSAFIENLFRTAKAATEDMWFLTGVGGAYPLGILNGGSTVRVPRATAGTIHFADIANMMARQIGPKPIWVCSQSALPQIMTIADANNNAMWIPAAYGGIQGPLPTTLAGYPIFFNYRLPALGNVGDLMLIDPSCYAVKDGSGPYIQSSPHVLFTLSQTIVKMEWFGDGAPWLKQPCVAEDGVTPVSAFVALQ